MKILLLIQREDGNEDGVAWVAEAIDEHTLEEYGLPTGMQKLVDGNPANVRSLWVEIPDNSFEQLWAVKTVGGKVVEAGMKEAWE